MGGRVRVAEEACEGAAIDWSSTCRPTQALTSAAASGGPSDGPVHAGCPAAARRRRRASRPAKLTPSAAMACWSNAAE